MRGSRSMGRMAARKQSKSKKKVRRRIKLEEQASRAKFLEKIKKHAIAAGKEILVDPPGQVKMSGVLLDFAAPLLERFEPEVPTKNIIGVAVVAWNLSLIPEEDRKRSLDEMAGEMSLDAEGIKGMNDVMTWLIDRKKKHFAEHKRYIVDYRLSDLGDQRGLQVVSRVVPIHR
jgi:hypothetical protein